MKPFPETFCNVLKFLSQKSTAVERGDASERCGEHDVPRHTKCARSVWFRSTAPSFLCPKSTFCVNSKVRRDFGAERQRKKHPYLCSHLCLCDCGCCTAAAAVVVQPQSNHSLFQSGFAKLSSPLHRRSAKKARDFSEEA